MARDPVLGEDVELKPDLLALAVGRCRADAGAGADARDCSHRGRVLAGSRQ
ncbi:MAG: hypothetical protein MZU91_14615 [Desulfosudis oleivorans]|nr:hypothetical protein [Desulfosudis oleivorans]